MRPRARSPAIGEYGQSIAVLADALGLKYGALRYASSDNLAYLAHAGLPHNPSYQVDWQR